jgi:hypothetical protein
MPSARTQLSSNIRFLAGALPASNRTAVLVEVWYDG